MDEIGKNDQFCVRFSICPECFGHLSVAYWTSIDEVDLFISRCEGCDIVFKGELNDM